ncbi:hypothetical protein [Rufibacter ruber]|uniref:hypothetical protein n=1 Tax=Rufibacter ruber TaxID=1783499 RepID=UPI00082C6423|nr:hypothetical protein [Rufibacter ruber]
MNREEAIAIIDALAAGCSPFTGEVLEDHPILNNRNVIRALQTALVSLSGSVQLGAVQKNQSDAGGSSSVELTKADVSAAIDVLKAANLTTSYSALTRFFLGSRRFLDTPVSDSPIF